MTGKSVKPRHRNNLASVFYTEELGARVVAQTGIPTDRFHIGKLIYQSLKERPGLLNQIDGAVNKSETNGSVLGRSVRCAIAMTRLGLKKGDVVVIMAPNHVDLIIPVYASMFLGIALVGTDMTLKIPELTRSFKGNKPKIVFCQSNRASDVEKALKVWFLDVHIITFDEGSKFQSFAEFLQEHSKHKVNVNDFKPADFDPEETVMLLTATGGTTYAPKSAILTHKNMAISVPQFMARYHDFPTPTKLYLLVSPSQWLSASIIYITSALYKFTRLQTSALTTRDHIYELINKYQPTAFLSSPTLMITLLDDAERGRCDFSCFETFIFCESFVPQSILDTLKIIAPESEPDIGYGMTEVGGMGLAFESEYPSSCVGKMSPHLQYRLVDPVTLEDVTEPNVTGELWCKGPSVSKGYYNNPKATEAAFTDGWFRTGDLLRRDECYHYFYVERLLKFKNHPVSPLEVEAVILQHPGVQDVVVVGVPDLECGDLATALVVVRNGHNVKAQEIKEIVKDNLGDTKQIMGGVIFLKELPVTSSNKVDRVKLKNMANDIGRE